jgi:hypothetical protein
MDGWKDLDTEMLRSVAVNLDRFVRQVSPPAPRDTSGATPRGSQDDPLCVTFPRKTVLSSQVPVSVLTTSTLVRAENQDRYLIAIQNIGSVPVAIALEGDPAAGSQYTLKADSAGGSAPAGDGGSIIFDSFIGSIFAIGIGGTSTLAVIELSLPSSGS